MRRIGAGRRPRRSGPCHAPSIARQTPRIPRADGRSSYAKLASQIKALSVVRAVTDHSVDRIRVVLSWRRRLTMSTPDGRPMGQGLFARRWIADKLRPEERPVQSRRRHRAAVACISSGVTRRRGEPCRDVRI
jgi:hypothetical protein